VAEVAKSALEIMHFDLSNGLPTVATTLIDQPDTCVAACYRCVMSYFNQPDHEQLDRRDKDARSLLLRLARGALEGLEAPVTRRPTGSALISGSSDLSTAWRTYARGRELPSPDSEPLVMDGQAVAFVWRSHYVAALFAPSSDLASKLENKGFEVVVVGETEAMWAESTTALAKLLGRPA
jgi:hypothetical protein